MRRIAAQYIFPVIGEPVPMGVVTLDDENRIIRIEPLHEETESTEFYNGIITAGFINAHCHLELSHLKGLYVPHGGLADFIRQISGTERYQTPVETQTAAMVAADQEMYEEGIVGVGDICNGGESFPVKHASAVFYHSFIELAGSDDTVAEKKIQVAQQLWKIVRQLGLTASITPHAAYSMSEQLLSATMKWANTSGILSVHNQESTDENELFVSGKGVLHDLFIKNGFALPPVTGQHAIYRLLPFIHPATTSLFIHNVATDENDYYAAVNRLPEITWVLCPNSNIRIGKTLPPIDMFYRKQAEVAIGTDSLASNNRLSIVEELKTISRHCPQIPLQTLLQWATLNGAKALKKDHELGSLCAGKKPGLVLIDNIDFVNMRLTADSRAKRLDN